MIGMLKRTRILPRAERKLELLTACASPEVILDRCFIYFTDTKVFLSMISVETIASHRQEVQGQDEGESGHESQGQQDAI